MPKLPPPPPHDAPAVVRLGYALRARREAMPGVRNRQQLAELLEYSWEVVRDVENGRYRARLQRFMTRWEAVVGLDPELEELWREVQAEDPTLGGSPARSPRGANLDAPDNRLGIMPVLDSGEFGGLEVSPVPTRRRMLGYVGASLMAAGLEPSLAQHAGFRRVLGALEVTHAGTLESLTALIEHFTQTFRQQPPTRLYDEIFGVRTYAGALLEDRPASISQRDLTVAAGWLSILLALVTYDLGDHTSAVVWCADAERRGRDAGHPELAGWAAHTKVLMAFYNDHAHQAIAHAQHGQTLTPMGTVAHAKLAAQEMRAWALLGDTGMVTTARRRAERAIAKLSTDTPTRSAFSISLTEDPPYTATSLLLLGRFAEAEAATRRVLAAFYQPRHTGVWSEHPSGFARSQLMLALALAGQHKLDQAQAAGSVALQTPRLDWPVTVLAGRLDGVLMREYANTEQARDFHERYRSAIHQRRPASLPTGDQGAAPDLLQS